MIPQLNRETQILWLDDAAKFPYLREKVATATARHGWRKAWRDGHDNYHVVAVAEMTSDLHSVHRRFGRRYWYFDLKKDPYPDDDFPSEAKVPSTILAGKMARSGRAF